MMLSRQVVAICRDDYKFVSMKKTIFAFVAAVLFTAPLFLSCSKEDQKEDEELTVCMQYKNLEIKSKIMKDKNNQPLVMKYNVLTPPSFNPNTEQYNVLYLLHGYGDDNNAWLDSPQSRGGTASLASQMFQAVRDGVITKTVVVMPDGLTNFYMGDWETYFYEELVPEVEKKFSIDGKRSRRVIAGLSMGGFGSAYHALAHSDFYCAVYTMSMASSDDMFGYLAAEAQKSGTLPSIFVVNGDSDATVGKAPEGFCSKLESLGIPFQYDHWMGGHDWKFWGECIPKFLEFFGEELKKNENK